MSRCPQLGRPIARRLRPGKAISSISAPSIASRSLSGTPNCRDEAAAAPPTTTADATSSTPEVVPSWTGKPANVSGKLTAFLEHPYQCFQEARRILEDDRREKLVEIVRETDKIRRLEAQDASVFRGGEKFKTKRLSSLRTHVEKLKILADINDPIVKMRFESGRGALSKPVYRYLAKQRWDGYGRKLMEQRVAQFHIVPDVLPVFAPEMDVQLFFGRYRIAPGAVVPSVLSERAPTLAVQVFDRPERLVTVVVMDSDVPDADSDGFSRRLHFMAANVPLSPTRGVIYLDKLDPKTQVAVPWLPAFAQKGAPYHRMSIFLLEQKAETKAVPRRETAVPGEGRDDSSSSSSSSSSSVPADDPPQPDVIGAGEADTALPAAVASETALDVGRLRDTYRRRDGFSLKSFRDRFPVVPAGFNLFRAEWDAGTARVMARHGLAGADVEFRRKRVHSLKPPRKARGWEAKRQGPKYRHLWKYTHRINTPKRKFVR